MIRWTDGAPRRARHACALLALWPMASAFAATDPCVALHASGFEENEDGSALAGLCDAGALNDSGVQFCGQVPVGDAAQCSGTEPSGQDADYGRDAQQSAGVLVKFGAGAAGFDYSKIANDGTALAADAVLGSAPGQWACTRDNLTGLIWEVKIVDQTHPRHHAQNYSWYFPDSPDGQFGDTGTQATCRGSLGTTNCNTLEYVSAVNASGLCGASDWRLPTVRELHGLVHYARAAPLIDTTYFPNTLDNWHWSSTPHSGGFGGAAWYTHFGDGGVSFASHLNTFRVLLVRRAP